MLLLCAVNNYGHNETNEKTRKFTCGFFVAQNSFYGMRGYLYIATRSHFVKEAIRSATSLRKVAPNAPIALIVTEKPKEDGIKVFNHMLIRPNTHKFEDSSHKHGLNPRFIEGLLYRVEHLYFKSPYEETFYLDTDTRFLANCTYLFNLLKNFDICMSHTPGDLQQSYMKGYFPYNTGVIIYKKNKKNDELFGKWFEFYKREAESSYNDQSSFMRALADSSSRVYVLRNNYNARTVFPIQLCGPVSILHGRHRDMDNVIKIINANPGALRLWMPKERKCYLSN